MPSHCADERACRYIATSCSSPNLPAFRFDQSYWVHTTLVTRYFAPEPCAQRRLTDGHLDFARLRSLATLPSPVYCSDYVPKRSNYL